jgi:hypothetical protein
MKIPALSAPCGAPAWQRRAIAWLRQAPRLTVALAVLLFVLTADCAHLAYELGRQTGAAVHARNDQLAALAVRLTVPPSATVPVAEIEPAPAAPVVPPQAALAPVALPVFTPAPIAAPCLTRRDRAVALRATGATQAAIAARLGCSRSTVRRLLTAPTA